MYVFFFLFVCFVFTQLFTSLLRLNSTYIAEYTVEIHIIRELVTGGKKTLCHLLTTCLTPQSLNHCTTITCTCTKCKWKQALIQSCPGPTPLVIWQWRNRTLFKLSLCPSLLEIRYGLCKPPELWLADGADFSSPILSAAVQEVTGDWYQDRFYKLLLWYMK